MEYSYGNADEGQVIFHPHQQIDGSSIDVSKYDDLVRPTTVDEDETPTKVTPSDQDVLPSTYKSIFDHQEENLRQLAKDTEEELDIRPTNEKFSDFVKGEINTNGSEDFDYDIDTSPKAEVPRLDLNQFESYLRDELNNLNAEFLSKVDQQFSEYLALTVEQIIFDRNLADKDFVKIFKTEEEYSESLDASNTAIRKIVDQKILDFAQDHIDAQTQSVEKLVKAQIKILKDLAAKNGGFPDTHSMQVALFAQLAFKYTQKSQRIYSKLEKKYIGETIREVTAKLNEIDHKPTFLQTDKEKKRAKEALEKN